MSFQQVSQLRNWIIGSLKSETGSEYLFGYDPELGLMWLERPGHEYSSSDQVWKEAEKYIRTSSLVAPAVEEWKEEQPPTAEVTMASTDGRPKTVTKSVAGGVDSDLPQPGDHRIVGDLEPAGPNDVDYGDEDIAGQAAEFLKNLGEEE